MNDDAAPAPHLEVLLQVPLQLTALLGTCRLSIADVLKLGGGSVVELDRPAGDPVDLLANGTPFARGEIVAVDAYFGVRITELAPRRPP